MQKKNLLNVALAQIAPVWLDKDGTLQRIYAQIEEAAAKDTELIVFGEGLLPGYPFWLALTGGAEWNTQVNKELYAHYVRNAVTIENGDLDPACTLAKKHHMAIYLGIIERPLDRGGHSLYASLVYINQEGTIQSVHRKLQPTYDERLAWAPGDGNGLKVHSLKQFTVGGLNCWENWMPLPRASLYGQGENLHIAVWPGSAHNTKDITRFIARDTPHYSKIYGKSPDILADGGSCIAGPDGDWILEPDTQTDGNIYHTIDFNKVYEERQNFDPVGHYSRPDVTKLIVNRERQSTISLVDNKGEE
jgi:nitrilase